MVINLVQMQLIRCCFFATFVLVHFNHCHVIRLPCRRHGNFSVQTTDFYRDGDLQEELNLISTATNCVTFCVARDICDFVNFNLGTKTCHLMKRSNTIKRNRNSGWSTLETEITVNVGPFCLKSQPCDIANEVCYDACASPFYQCKAFTEVAPHNIADKGMPSQFTDLDSSSPATKAIDNSMSTSSSTLGTTTNTWWQLDFGANVWIYHVKLELGTGYEHPKLAVYVDSKTASSTGPPEKTTKCYETIKHVVETFHAMCTNFPLRGNYLIIYKTKTWYEKAIFLREVFVYVKDLTVK